MEGNEDKEGDCSRDSHHRRFAESSWRVLRRGKKKKLEGLVRARGAICIYV